MTVYVNRTENFLRTWYKRTLRLLPDDLNNKKIIDIAGGTAEFSRILRDRGAIVTHTDLSETSVNHAISLGFESYIVDLNKPLTFKNKEFDGIILLEAIEHILHTDQLLSEINRILNDDGFIILSTPNVANIKCRIKNLIGYPPLGEGYHLRFFTKRTLYSILKKHNFKVVNKYNSTSTLGLNSFRKMVGLNSKNHQVPSIFEGLLVKNFTLLLKKLK